MGGNLNKKNCQLALTEEQYKRANGAIYPIIMIILGYISLSMVMWARSQGAAWRTWMQLAFSVAAMVIKFLSHTGEWIRSHFRAGKERTGL